MPHHITDPPEPGEDNGEDTQSGGSSSEIDRDPGASPADESRERPERPVAGNYAEERGGRQGQDPTQSNAGQTVAAAAVAAADRVRQNAPKKKKYKRDKEHTRLKSAIDQGADAADAER